MNDKIIDFIGEAMWVMTFLTPLITLPVFWRKKSLTKAERIVMALVVAALFSIVFFLAAFAIAFRNGMGP